MNWIKIEVTTPDKPEVIMMAEALGIDHDAVVGKLFRLWIWADLNTVAGDLVKVTCGFIDRIAGHPGFADALREVGWLKGRDGSLSFPNFDRHNGASAKARAENNRRVKNHRERNGICNGKRNGNVTVQSLQKPLPDQIRSDQNLKPSTSPKPPSPETAVPEGQDRRGLGSGSGSGSNEFSGQDLAELRRELGQDFDRAAEWAKANARTNWIGFLAKTCASGRQPWRAAEPARTPPVGHNSALRSRLPEPPPALQPMRWTDYRAHVEASPEYTAQPDWWGLLQAVALGLSPMPTGVVPDGSTFAEQAACGVVCLTNDDRSGSVPNCANDRGSESLAGEKKQSETPDRSPRVVRLPVAQPPDCRGSPAAAPENTRTAEVQA